MLVTAQAYTVPHVLAWMKKGKEDNLGSLGKFGQFGWEEYVHIVHEALVDAVTCVIDLLHEPTLLLVRPNHHRSQGFDREGGGTGLETTRRNKVRATVSS
eukprot:2143368-Rhodomonas_salina.1